MVTLQLSLLWFLLRNSIITINGLHMEYSFLLHPLHFSSSRHGGTQCTTKYTKWILVADVEPHANV